MLESSCAADFHAVDDKHCQYPDEKRCYSHWAGQKTEDWCQEEHSSDDPFIICFDNLEHSNSLKENYKEQ